MAGRTFLIDGQSISNDEQYSDDEDQDEEEIEYQQHHNLYEEQYHNEGRHEKPVGDEEEEDFDSLIEDEKVPSMPTGFYSEVDAFLSRPPPGISKTNNAKGGKKKASASDEQRGKNSERSLPDISDAAQLKNVQGKVQSRRSAPGGTGKKTASRALDERLLQQAFEYTNKLQQEAMVEEVYEASLHLQKHKSSSAPQLRQQQLEEFGDGVRATAAGGGGQRKPRSADNDLHRQGSSSSAQVAAAYGHGKKKPASSIVRRLRSKTQTSSGGQSGRPPRDASSSAGTGGFDTSCDVESATSNRNVTDFNSLVANFEQGTHLQQLREELERSQASMAQSRRAMQDISKEMAGKLRI